MDSYACMLALRRLPESISSDCDFGPWSCRPLPEGKLKQKAIVRTFSQGPQYVNFLRLGLRVLSFTRSLGYESREFRSKVMRLKGLKSNFGALKEN